MVKSFKFFDENDDEYVLRESSPTWMWDTDFFVIGTRTHRWVIDRIQCSGILDFLSLFPDYYIVPVHSITGNGITHTGNSEQRNDGWGFNIREEYLTIDYYRPLPNDEV